MKSVTTTTRNSYWDNAKFLLIFLVVVGHFSMFFTGDIKNMRRVYYFIYIFHMPAFIFISGIFSKKTVAQKRYPKIFSFLLLYILTKILLFLSNFFTSGNINFSLLSEADVPWYVFAIFVFNLLSICFSNIKTSYLILMNIILACFFGYDTSPPDYFVMLRIVVFYPFFLLGLRWDRNKVEEFLNKRVIRILALLILVGTALVVYRYIDSIWWSRTLLSGRNPYYVFEKEGYKTMYQLGGLIRLLYYPLVFGIMFAFFALVPREKNFFSTMGKRTLTVYMLHYCFTLFIMRTFHGTEWIRTALPIGSTLLIFPISLVLTMFLSSKLFERPIHWLMNLTTEMQIDKKIVEGEFPPSTIFYIA